ncbi:hypothetical protein NL676_012895 [Syzygium grande]|nr:hypothetical protein NL676_012895 [Syzygium grande]
MTLAVVLGTIGTLRSTTVAVVWTARAQPQWMLGRLRPMSSQRGVFTVEGSLTVARFKDTQRRKLTRQAQRGRLGILFFPVPPPNGLLAPVLSLSPCGWCVSTDGERYESCGMGSAHRLGVGRELPRASEGGRTETSPAPGSPFTRQSLLSMEGRGETSPWPGLLPSVLGATAFNSVFAGGRAQRSKETEQTQEP